MLSPAIFKAYDIRGIYPDDFDESGASVIGLAFASLLTQKSPDKPLRIVVGSDARTSSPSLKAALIDGIRRGGVNVDDIGLVSTPTFYGVAAQFEYDGGVQVSASHNPKEWNGFKLVFERGIAMSKTSGIETMRDMIAGGQLAESHEHGDLRDREELPMQFMDAQLEELKKTYGPIAPLKVVVDVANGMGVLDMKAFFATVPAEVTWLFDEVDGTFPNHPADPAKAENTGELRKRIVETGSDLGIASDGDGDRYFFFDEKGEVVPPEIFRGLMAQVELREHPGSKIAYDIRPGRITRDMIEAAGGIPLLTRVGHSLIKETMRDEDAIFGAESSGHYFYRLPFGIFEAPLILVYKFLSLLAREGKPLSEIVAPYRTYFNSGEINTRLASSESGLQKIAEIRARFNDGAITELDGLSVDYPDFWFSIRMSNTEPLIRFIVESSDEGTMERRRDEILALIRT